MDNLNQFKELEQLLRNESQFCTEDGHLLKNAIVEAALAMRPELLHLLLSHERLRNNFFVDVNGITVFDKVKFQKFVMNKRFLPDSYTCFKNKVGVTDSDSDNFLSESREVVLSWPYKDCMLEGGQTKDDAKRNEIFWNEILAPDEINRLIEPKALSNFSKYDVEGIHNVSQITKDDNIILKGNNLLALYTLKKKYNHKVKVICIDPPYYFTKPKDSDSFNYNSNFRLSTWLTFMRNRLEVAKDLLAPGGVIFCHIKEDGIHWLKVLMEDIFKVENFVETFIWRCTDNPDSLSKKSRAAVEYILCYEVPKDSSRQYIGKQTENGDAPILHTGNNIHELVFPAGSIQFRIADGTYEGKPDRVELITPVIVKNGVNENEVTLKGEFTWSQETLDENYKNGCYFLVKSAKFSVRVQLPEGKSMAPEKYFDEQYLSKAIGVGSNEDASTHIAKMGLDFSYSKPESVVAFLLKAVSKPGDLVLDFFLGSGTTAAVAMKMGRRFIGVDQMDYIKTTACARLQKVIEGEQGGISQSVNWHGGGSFVYCELATANQRFVDTIEAATTTEQLKNIWSDMQATGFLSWKVKPQEIDENISDFAELTLDDQKRFLIECLDKNLLYVPYSEINNQEFGISEDEKNLNSDFYSIV
jgi:adenine-specific DNA-methyltransferase